jgi:hypothetical protein
MKNIFIVSVLAFFVISCNGNQSTNSPSNKAESIQEYKSTSDTLFNIGNDTIALFYGVSKNIIRVKADQNRKIVFDKTIKIKDFINDAPYKEKTYIDKIYYTGFEKDTKEMVFTAYLKRTDDDKFKMEAVFTLDLNGSFNWKNLLPTCTAGRQYCNKQYKIRQNPGRPGFCYYNVATFFWKKSINFSLVHTKHKS